LVNGTANGQIPTKFEVGTSAKFDLGLDLKLFNKVSIVTDYFTDTRKDLLIPNIPVSGITELCSRASAPTVNAGTVKNSGIEFLLITKIPFRQFFYECRL
jgi:outer membrane receptor protein involved in Fe transport